MSTGRMNALGGVIIFTMLLSARHMTQPLTFALSLWEEARHAE